MATVAFVFKNGHRLPSLLLPIGLESIKPLLVPGANVIGWGRASPLFPHRLFHGTRIDADIRRGAGENGWFVVPTHNIIPAIPAAIFGHRNPQPLLGMGLPSLVPVPIPTLELAFLPNTPHFFKLSGLSVLAMG
jgi:hypothetical protein